MKYSLPSREVIADSIETVVSAQFYDAVVPVVGCDKNMPGAIIAMGRLNRPGILVYGGTVKKGPGRKRPEILCQHLKHMAKNLPERSALRITPES